MGDLHPARVASCAYAPLIAPEGAPRMLPDDEICLILVVSRGEVVPDERVMRLATAEAERSGVELGQWLGLRRIRPEGPTCHVFLGVRL